MAEQRNKSNKKFMVLSAIGIIMVVDHHTWTALNMFGDYIPYNSFFMPMFVFISGYFNKVDATTKLGAYAIRKIKTLILPYFVISMLVFGLQWLINWFKLGEIPTIPSGYLIYILERVVTIGSSISIAEPMWFVISLFTVLFVYAFLKKLLFRFWNSYVMLGIFCCMNVLAVYWAKNMQGITSSYFLLPLKCMFFLPFIEMGIIYREYLEKKHEGLPCGGKIAILFVALLVNMIRIMYLPVAYDVAFDSLGEMNGFTSPFIVTPLISSVVGMAFWVTMVDLLGKAFYDSRFVNYLSCNTFWIMGLHIAFFNILNCILMVINEHIIPLPYFSTESFRESEWYRWELSPNFKLAYLVIGILGPLSMKWIYDKICTAIAGKMKRTHL